MSLFLTHTHLGLVSSRKCRGFRGVGDVVQVGTRVCLLRRFGTGAVHAVVPDELAGPASRASQDAVDRRLRVVAYGLLGVVSRRHGELILVLVPRRLFCVNFTTEPRNVIRAGQLLLFLSTIGREPPAFAMMCSAIPMKLPKQRPVNNVHLELGIQTHT